MEPVITPLRTLRAGIEFTFRGCPPDDSGEPSGDLFEIELVIPPLNLDTLQRLDARLSSFGTGTHLEQMKTLVIAVEQCLKRNYAGVPTWLIAQTVDLANMPSLFQAVMDLSGLRRKASEDEKKAKASSLNGTTSTHTSLPAQDTPGTQ